MALPLLLAHAHAGALWQNLTVWHVHPSSNRKGDLSNMNSGDEGGDLFFASRDRWLPIACGNDTGYSRPYECSMTEVKNTKILAISQVLVEVDTEAIGSFLSCNLVQDPAISFPRPTKYSCSGHSHHHPGPPPPACDSYHDKATCAEEHGYSGPVCEWQPSTSTCAAMTCATIVDEVACKCSAKAHRRDAACVASPQKLGDCFWNGTGCMLDNTTVGTETVGNFFGPGNAPSTRPGHSIAPWDWWKQGLVRLFGAGLWFSTAAAGQCDPAQQGVPAGCTWRAVSEVKRVGKPCADASIGGFVEKADTHGCFDACAPADRSNSSSACWIGCFFKTVLGPTSSSVIPSPGGMPLAALSEAWRRPFESSDATQGGCPAI